VKRAFVVLVLWIGATSARAQFAGADVELLGGIAANVGGDSSHGSAVDLGSAATWGVDANFRFHRSWSLVFGFQIAYPSVHVDETPVPLASADIRMGMLEWVFQWHPWGGADIDPYVGVGTALVFTSDATLVFADGSGSTARLHMEPALAIVGELGVRFAVSKKIGILVDAKYASCRLPGAIPITDVPGGNLPDVDMKGILSTAGLSIRF